MVYLLQCERIIISLGLACFELFSEQNHQSVNAMVLEVYGTHTWNSSAESHWMPAKPSSLGSNAWRKYGSAKIQDNMSHELVCKFMSRRHTYHQDAAMCCWEDA